MITSVERDLMQDYWKIIKERAEKFCKPNDILIFEGVYQDADKTCELCGKHPIAWINVLRNTRTKEKIRIGSECIKNVAKYMCTGQDGQIYYVPDMENIFTHFLQRYPTITNRFKLLEDGEYLDKDQRDFEEDAYESLYDVDWDCFDYETGD